MSNLEKRAVDATAAYLCSKGYDVLDVLDGNEAVKIVARDNDTDETVFVSVQLRQRASDAEPAQPQRAEYEAEACEWLADHGNLGKCRFDAVLLTVAGDGRALLCHHINCLGTF